MPFSEPEVLAAIVSALIAALGVAASFHVSRHQVRASTRELDLRARELDLKTRELERWSSELEAQFESFRQTQLTEVLRERIRCYPKLWNVMLTYGLNWSLAGKLRDASWAKGFLAALNSCNAECGVFFSEPVYAKFHEFRGLLTLVERKLARGELVSEEEYHELFKIESGDSVLRVPGLATHMKNDLGSYRDAAIQRVRSPGANEAGRV